MSNSGHDLPLNNLTLCLQIHPTQYIQAHTVLKTVVDKYADVPVLVLGGRNDDVRKVAERHAWSPLLTFTKFDVRIATASNGHTRH